MEIEQLETVLQEEKVPWGVKLMDLSSSLMGAAMSRSTRLGTVLEKHVPANSKPVDGIFSNDVVIDAANNVWIRIFTPTQEEDASKEKKAGDDGADTVPGKKLPIIVAFHGGGFVAMGVDFNQYDSYFRQIVREVPAVVIGVNYRLAPQFPYPAAFEDCYKLFEWMRSPESQSHLPAIADVSKCFLLGESAGGNIVHFVGCRFVENEAEMSPIKVRGWVELQPFYGGEEITECEKRLAKAPVLSLDGAHSAWKAFLPEGSNRDHMACNVFGPNSPDISGLALPPIFVGIGSLDILKDRQLTYVKKLKEMGKDVTAIGYAGGFHGFMMFPQVNKVLAEKGMADAYDFVRSHSL